MPLSNSCSFPPPPSPGQPLLSPAWPSFPRRRSHELPDDRVSGLPRSQNSHHGCWLASHYSSPCGLITDGKTALSMGCRSRRAIPSVGNELMDRPGCLRRLHIPALYDTTRATKRSNNALVADDLTRLSACICVRLGMPVKMNEYV